MIGRRRDVDETQPLEGLTDRSLTDDLGDVTLFEEQVGAQVGLG